MQPATQRVLTMLRKKKKGISVRDFGNGFRLSHQIYELRNTYNMDIHMERVEVAKDVRIGVYTLIKE